MMEGGDKVLFMSVFTTWKQLVGELQRELVNERRVLAMMVGDQSRLKLAETFAAWSRVFVQAQQKWRHARKTMALLVGGRARLALAQTLAAWMRAVVDRREELGRERAAQEQREQQERHRESMLKSLRLMMDGGDKVLFMNVFITWKQLVSELRRELVNERRVLAMMVGDQSRLKLAETFAAWSRVFAEAQLKWRHART